MIVSVEQLLWRAGLRQAPVIPGSQDLIAWAPYFGEDGRLLLDCATLLDGFSPEAIAGRAGETAPPMTGWTLDIAIRELQETAQRFKPTLVAPDDPRPSGRPDSPVGIGRGIPAAELPEDLGAIVRSLVALLGDAADPDEAALCVLLEALIETARRLPTLDYRLLADGPAELLVTAIAATVLGDFASGIRDLACAPLGSPALLHRSARFASAGLGPWFRNVGRLVRTSHDVFDLARIACAAASSTDEDSADESSAGKDTVGAWIALLSRGCEGHLLRHLSDDLADYGAMAPLSAILDRTLSRSFAAIDLGVVMYLRDAALDNVDYKLAARAQATIVRSCPNVALELEILGSILASDGELAEAHATFSQALDIDPGHPGVRARLATLGTTAFEPFIVRRGFGSPADRVHARLNRRGVAFDYARRKGERIAAVDVR